MMLPTFLIIGAAKSGTTSLYHYLSQHPEVYMSPLKEPKFFAYEGERLAFNGPLTRINENSVTTLDDYKKLFADVTNEKAVGEASPIYLHSEKAPERIRRLIPSARIIAVLRHPADRAFSSYVHLLRNSYETELDFLKALGKESERKQQNWAPLFYYRERGFYYQQLKRYFTLFDREQIRVYRFDDFVADPKKIMRDIFSFIGVDASFEPDLTVRYNVSGIPKNRLFHKAARELQRKGNPVTSLLKIVVPKPMRKSIRDRLTIAATRNLRRQELPPHIRKMLSDEYREDILKVQELTGLDLSPWLES